MMVLVCYDVDTTTASGQKRLRKVAKMCEDYGQRVQNSVFECLLDEDGEQKMRQAVKRVIRPRKDHVRFYYLCLRIISLLELWLKTMQALS